jgi:hypothetical protein
MLKLASSENASQGLLNLICVIQLELNILLMNIGLKRRYMLQMANKKQLIINQTITPN